MARRFARDVFNSILSLALVFSLGAAALAEPASECETAALNASRKTGVPLSVLRAISLVETGRSRAGETRPWPWTVNMEGKGVWFDERAKAENYVLASYRKGARSFDVGCFQLNYRWHGQHFASITEMFDPQANADYAARFLQELYQEKGNWSTAAGAYHSRTPTYANRYRKKFDEYFAALSDQPTPPAIEPVAVSRQNRYPLLRDGQTPGGLGSLVPLGGATARSLFDRSAEGRG
ncbi:transglycosylase SLT domain-containing protein [Actibacterium sp. XHP0104]|uniref:transglycosylase SLT domain-containing protein n=1 Tax=Actibacterium sp. XHP0104 TaxID=2984335 RepID=UPI0021E87986|nr:transglycosylase SLT domain-containing protein [Actibacterium sp. XHP0104]MCV2881812.1 transglycosylase SLT domain-containing protein [Actibacterium sp. XHP0104]